MSSNIRKCLCFGPDGFETVGSYQSYVNGSNRTWINDSTTKWVRIWMNWRTMNADKMTRLDQQIQQLNNDGRPVILVLMHEFPTWLDGGRSNIYLIPNNRAVDSDWGRFIESIYTRYMPFKPNPGPTIHMLEVVNEPNLMFQPRDGALPGKVVEMMNTAQAISAKYDHQLYLGGPALADSTAAGVDWRVFHDGMRATGWQAAQNFVWTHHNYGDVESNNDSTRQARDRLASWWSGYDEGDGPIVFGTEGGARLVVIGEGQYARQRDLVAGTFDKLFSAARVGMQSNFLMYDAQTRQPDGRITHYSGLRGPAPGGEERLVYPAWRNRNTGYPDLYRWREGELFPPWTKWDPGMLSQHPGHLEVFAAGLDDNIYNRWTGNNGSSWSAWSGLGNPGGPVQSAPGAISIRDGTMDIFVVGPGSQLFQRWWSASGWSDWHGRGGICSFDPAVASFNDQHIQVFVRAGDGTLWHRWWWASGGWSQWHQLWGGQVVGSPSAVSWDYGRIDLVFRGTDNGVHHMYYDGTWRGPNPLGGWTDGHPDITSWKPGHLDIVIPGGGNKLYRKTFDRVWSQWEPIPHTYYKQFSPAAVSSSPGRIDVVFQRDERIKHVWYG
jgi:Repeat of unknown function (DUF346)